MQLLRLQTAAVFAVCLLSEVVASAGGFEPPILYGGRHGGMGGVGIAGANGGDSLYLNPAGLGRIGKANLYLGATILHASLEAAPSFLTPARASTTAALPFPFVSGGVRVHENIVVGAAFYPVGGAGGTFNYLLSAVDAEPQDDKTQLFFLEGTVGVAANFDKIGLNIGAGYRVTITRLDRVRPDAFTTLDLQLTGVDFAGFRAGFQWQLTDFLSIGAVYRTKVTIDASASGGRALNTDLVHAETTFIFPSRVGGGVQFDWGAFTFATEFEWLFNSQNDVLVFATEPELPLDVKNRFDWTDEWFLRFGAEYRTAKDHLALRLGFAYESETTSVRYPNAFGPPPTATALYTMGIGYDHGPWEINMSYARTTASRFVDDDTNPVTPDPSDDALVSTFLSECPNCSGPGNYAFKANHIMFDFSYDWE